MQGAVLSASDISDAMVNETKQKWQRLAVTGSTQPSTTEQPTFEAKDLESVSGRYHTVCCLDVLIHYPQVQLFDFKSTAHTCDEWCPRNPSR